MIKQTRSIPRLFTIGHSDHPFDRFCELLHLHSVTVVADVRSSPYSRQHPQFNRNALENVLECRGLGYVFLGRELGARRNETECYMNGKAKYDLIALAPAFAKGLARIRQELAEHRVAIMCAEKDPLTCHRAILICRKLRGLGIDMAHILEDGSLETIELSEDRLLGLLQMPAQDLFRNKGELIEDAYDRQAEKIAYVRTELAPEMTK